MGTWFARHAQTCVGSLGRLAQQPIASLLTVLVIGIALALPTCLQVLIANARSATGDLTSAIDISVYLQAGTSAQQARETADRIRQRRDVARVDLIEADDALREFREYSGFGAALDALADNPLPHALVVRPRAEALDPGAVESLTNDLRRLETAELVQLDTEWVQRFHAILDAVRRATLLIAGLLGIGVMVIVGNTIRLDIQNRRDEIEVTKLIGATNAFVRRPFLYTGFWYGLGGAVAALVITLICVLALTGPVQRLAGMYGSAFQLAGIELRVVGFVLGAGVGLGWLGSWLAATRHLRRIEPR